MSDTLTLNCFVLGDTPDHIFPVEIALTKTVGALKEAIKDKKPHAFRSVDADQLVLYRTSNEVATLDDDDALMEALADTSGRGHHKLDPRGTLLKIFKDVPSPEALHILVQLPSTPPPVPQATLTLNCFVLGDTPDHIFPVEIALTKTVGALKKAIKEEKPHAFHTVDADQLVLYRTSNEVATLDDDDALMEALADASGRGHHKLGFRRTLLEIFKDVPPHSALHVLVQLPFGYKPPVAVPDLIVNCVVRGDKTSEAFLVEISGTKVVAYLKEAIRNRMRVFDDVSASHLVLYNVSFPLDGNLEEKLEGLNLHHATQLSDPFQTLSDIEFPPKRLHIVVEAPLSMRLRSHPALTARSLEHNGVGSQRRTFLANNPPRAPSSAGRVKCFSPRQADKHHAIYCNRPYDVQATIPPTLLHPVFGQFLDDCETYDTTPDDNSFVLGLHIAMSKFYSDEKSRAEAIRAEFSHWGLHLVVSKTPKGFETDGDMFMKGHRLAITEIKNEIGNGGAEPYSQVCLYYLESTRSFAEKMRGSCLPCMILLVFGPYIAFAGAAWNLRPVVQTLSSPLPMHCHTTDTVMRINVARHLGAFKKAVATLEEYYQNLGVGPAIDPVQSQLFPHFNSFTSLQDNSMQELKYINQPLKDNLVFFAALCNQQLVCIKFARRYSKDAHEICASLGHAPALHGFEKIPGGWYMIVMDKLPNEYDMLCGPTPPISLINDIRKNALAPLHEQGYVHGDIRDTNIMVPKSDKTKFMLVDFEWAGKNGEVRYPMNVNKGPTLWRPDGAVDGALIRPEHDIDMLNYITTWNDLDMIVD
ncbi:hypothetical protein J3A83DRAFT_4263978 [Scleroderma citrinum]